MISNRLKNIFGISILVFIAHGIEEMAMNFSGVDSHVAFIFGNLAVLPTMQALFILFQIMFWLTLIVSFLLLQSSKWQLRLMFLPALVFIYELHHFYKAVETGGYYPGLITALAFPIIGFLFWMELIRNYRAEAK